MHSYKNEMYNLIKLAVPVLIASISQTSMNFVDTIMAGGVSTIDMAAVAIASSIWLPLILFGAGLLTALVPIVAQLNGSDQQIKIPFEIQQGISLAIICSIPIIMILLQIRTILDIVKLEPLITIKISGYIYAMIFSVPACLLFQTLRSLTDGLSLTKPAMVIGIIGLIINIPINWMLVYGKFGLPKLGSIGCGIATSIVYWLMFIMLLIYILISKRIAHIQLFFHFYKPRVQSIIKLFKLGIPIGAATFIEVTLFAIVALFIAPLGPNVVSAHQIAINFSSLIFMLPMSIGVAVSIRVGHQLGKRNLKGAKITSKVAVTIGFFLALITAISTIIFRENIVLLYSNNNTVTSIAMELLLFAAFYQCTDAIQIISAGALRGYKDMKSIFNRTFISYWILGLPIGYILSMTNIIVEPMGVHGFWIGFIIGVSSAAFLLSLKLHMIHHNKSIKLKFISK
ncbi:multidrug resistance protein [Candidatus Photodesmus katoptron]|uniref:Multidrug resistance protein NorM n=1 Tax=Candidatus Photodesmus katoptron Akat1 TaxID=1236703 RepID=S3DG66_9GAMM|nr:MATE family efflux transporter [Candidatus Photodesmus katoptron]EPE37412.1 multidrug resistance protein NorM [Candidatus Photodesmus katoptron Akat1]KEY90822.1 multidrug resistance protein [Candidatus Photodesmus katoptron]